MNNKIPKNYLKQCEEFNIKPTWEGLIHFDKGQEVQYSLSIAYDVAELHDLELDYITVISRDKVFDYEKSVESLIKLVESVGGIVRDMRGNI